MVGKVTDESLFGIDVVTQNTNQEIYLAIAFLGLGCVPSRNPFLKQKKLVLVKLWMDTLVVAAYTKNDMLACVQGRIYDMMQV